MTTEQKKMLRVYDDEEIGWRIHELVDKKEIVLSNIVETGTMLQQLMDERDALLKDLKALEAEVNDAMHGSADWAEVDLNRSEKYCDTEQKGDTG